MLIMLKPLPKNLVQQNLPNRNCIVYFDPFLFAFISANQFKTASMLRGYGFQR